MRPRLAFLDGIRGAAALFVVTHHAAFFVRPEGLTPPLARLRGALVLYGHFSVAVFIVLSGYCLMLPVALDPSARLRGGFRGYIARRAWRILPPYYAVVGLTLAVIALAPALQSPAGSRWDGALPAFDPGALASHLLLVHNLDIAWAYKINPPLWSVATEWQIYFLFPALIAVGRRLGWAAAAAVGFGLGYGLCLARPSLTVACPWYAGLFAVGMAAATVRPSTADSWRPAAFGALALALGLGVVLLEETGAMRRLSVLDPLVGAATACLILYCRETASWGGAGGAVSRIFGSRGAVALGAFSYSLYLVHYPVIALAHFALAGAVLGPGVRLGLMLLAVTPLCVAAGLGFHVAVERRFMPGHPSTAARAATAAVISPAP